MSRRDALHDVVKNALVKDGWVVTHDPYIVKFGTQNLQVGLGAELPLAAERNGRKIAVEVKSFLGESAITEMYAAIGQYAVYRPLVRRREADRTLYLAVPEDIYDQLFELSEGRDVREEVDVKLLVFSPTQEAIVRWIE